MDSDNLKGDVVNLDQTNELAIQALAETILDIVDTSSEITYEPLPDDDPKRRCPDITKARRVLD